MASMSDRLRKIMDRIEEHKIEEARLRNSLAKSSTPFMADVYKAKLARSRDLRKAAELEARVELKKAETEYNLASAAAKRAHSQKLAAQATIWQSRYNKLTSALGGGRKTAQTKSTTGRTSGKTSPTRKRKTTSGKVATGKVRKIASGVSKEAKSVHNSLIDW